MAKRKRQGKVYETRKIVATFGPAIASYENTLAVLEAGVDVARMNMRARTKTLIIDPGNPTMGASEARPAQSLQAPGIRDVAAAAGVTTATVSRALRGLQRVSRVTGEKVMAAATNLGYVACAAASELARGQGGQNATFIEARVALLLRRPERTGSYPIQLTVP